MTPYPDEPWHLAGQMYLSLWPVPRADLPPVAVGTRPVTVAGRGLAGAAWVVYENDSVLHYGELLRAVLVRDGGRPRVCITDIWVDSPASMAGGRALWGIPKEMAVFEAERTDVASFAAKSDDGPLAAARFEERGRLPGRLPLSYRIVQTLDGRTRTSRVRSRASVRAARAAWTVPSDGRLADLGRRAPLISLTLRDFTLSFGG
ncbi:acetoacetate decarboxylase family protein [Streptomyces sp. NPDC090106]|uniref:acetoacetate decarboxylase family protein n=1 Tax=Streptomyces sp. NPDC090106 TaxID=3365946 RepID=UPI0037F41C61